jgi:hypothetical protein
MYVNLLDHIESRTLAVLPYGTEPIPGVLAYRLALHTEIIDAIEVRDRGLALSLIAQHNTNASPDAAPRDQGGRLVGPAPSLVGLAVAGPDLKWGAFGGDGPGHVQAEPGLLADDGPVVEDVEALGGAHRPQLAG